mgnify:CR=1 FL=1
MKIVYKIADQKHRRTKYVASFIIVVICRNILAIETAKVKIIFVIRIFLVEKSYKNEKTIENANGLDRKRSHLSVYGELCTFVTSKFHFITFQQK